MVDLARNSGSANRRNRVCVEPIPAIRPDNVRRITVGRSERQQETSKPARFRPVHWFEQNDTGAHFSTGTGRETITKHITEQMRVNLPATKVCSVLDDFGGIERYAPTIKRSPVLTDKTTGLGAKRRCEFYAGGSLIEEIVDYRDGRSLTVELSEHGMPVKSMVTTMAVESVDADTRDLHGARLPV